MQLIKLKMLILSIFVKTLKLFLKILCYQLQFNDYFYEEMYILNILLFIYNHKRRNTSDERVQF